MLTRIIAAFAALAVIGLAAVIAPLPAVAQSDSGGSTSTATATATPTATPAPGPMSFSLTPHIGTVKPHGLAYLDKKWYVSGVGPGYVHIFSDNGNYERTVNQHRRSRGLASHGSTIFSVHATGSPLHTWSWTPTAAMTKDSSGRHWASLTNLRELQTPRDGAFRSEGIAHDGTNTWIAISGPTSGPNKFSKHILIKRNATDIIWHRMDAWTTALAYENGHLYGLTKSDKPDLIRINPDNLQPYTAAALLNPPLAEPPLNNWTTWRRDAGIKDGLAFRDGVPYGFNDAKDAIQAARGGVVTTTAPASSTASSTGSATNPSN